MPGGEGGRGEIHQDPFSRNQPGGIFLPCCISPFFTVLVVLFSLKLKQSHTSRSEFPIQSDQVRSQTMSLFNFESIFGKPKEKKSPADEAKEWKRQLSREMRRIDRDMNDLTRAEKNAAAECKKLAKQNQLPAAKLLAKEIVNTRKARERMMTAKAQLNSASMALQSSISLMKVQGVVAKSTEVMVAMNQLIKLPEVSKTMTAMAREMERAGLVESMISDTFEMIEPTDMDIAADAEVSKVIEELTSEIFAGAKSAPTSRPTGTAIGSGATATVGTRSAEEEAAAQAEMDADLKAMQSRLGAL